MYCPDIFSHQKAGSCKAKVFWFLYSGTGVFFSKIKLGLAAPLILKFAEMIAFDDLFQGKHMQEIVGGKKNVNPTR
jgi:hypothetical protein